MPGHGEERGSNRFGEVTPSLETGNILTVPIGYIESCFMAKNGTPRQPSVCSFSRACLKIHKSVFNNPEHSVIGLDQFSHVWILFVFHQNGRLSCKAKVQPPRLNGAKTGVFSTRSPHRPNAIGLTLAKLEKVEGGTIYLSGIDMIQGTPVLDIKPYIADYDSPRNTRMSPNELTVHEGQLVNEKCWPVDEDTPVDCKGADLLLCSDEPVHSSVMDGFEAAVPMKSKEDKEMYLDSADYLRQTKKPEGRYSDMAHVCEVNSTFQSRTSTQVPKQDLLQEVSNETPESGLDNSMQSSLHENSLEIQPLEKCASKGSTSSVPSWVSNSPVTTLHVRFTPHSEMELRTFKAADDTDPEKTPFKYFQSPEEAKRAITTLLAADPRSVYRRKRCVDRLYYFTLDMVHITCWFGEGFAEVLRVKPISSVHHSGNG